MTQTVKSVKNGKKPSFQEIEQKWQKRWEEKKAFESKTDTKQKKFYNLEMYAYPSGSGLHMGHAFNYTIGDIRARFKRMQGFNVLYPTGYDSFGLPAENAAIRANSHPHIFTDNAITNFIRQQKALGLSYDWTRRLQSHDPAYYRWNQFFFLQFLKNGLVYRKKSPVNWCPKCETVLANEQVHDGKCWRHGDTDVEIKPLEQWFIKTTQYAQELLDCADKLNWPERIKTMQKNWIGKSEGSEILFKVGKEDWPVFTTRPDTLMGVTFLVVSAQHPRLQELVTREQKNSVSEFLKRIKSTSEKDALDLEKDGVFTGSFAVHPITGDRIPIWTGNFVVADYGSGMVMAVPAHDQRDMDFATKYKIPIKQVVAPSFLDKNNPPREGAENTKRTIIHAIVLSEKKDKFIALRNKTQPWLTPVTGGVEEGEDIIKAAEREIIEETGYQNFVFERKMPYEMQARFYAAHKKVNREVTSHFLVFRLKNEERKPLAKEEADKHEVEWLPISKLNSLHPVSELSEMVSWFNSNNGAYTGNGILTNSGEFDGLESEKAKDVIIEFLNRKKLGKKVVQYKLRDWLVSRQRYWGTPIPVVYCDGCGCVPVPEKELPILLPDDVKFGEGNPLATSKTFNDVNCPHCGEKARRETDTMDTFFDSSWYYLRFTDPKNKKEPFSKKDVSYWMPVDFYVGGAEHANMHLIYARFFTKALRDMGFLKFDEPFTRLFNQGMIHGEDGFVMSKSRGNVIDPLKIAERYSADSLRLFLVSMANPDKDFSWSVNGFEGSWKFAQKIENFTENVQLSKKASEKVGHKTHLALREVTQHIENVQYNLAVISIRELLKAFEDNGCDRSNFEIFIKMISPFCPHLSEELWERLGNKGFVSLEEWPKVDESKINEKFEQGEKAVDNLSKDLANLLNLVKQKGIQASKAFVYVLPQEKELYNAAELEKRVGIPVTVYAVNEKDKYDPQGKAAKAKPGKAGIYLE